MLCACVQGGAWVAVLLEMLLWLLLVVAVAVAG